MYAYRREYHKNFYIFDNKKVSRFGWVKIKTKSNYRWVDVEIVNIMLLMGKEKFQLKICTCKSDFEKWDAN